MRYATIIGAAVFSFVTVLTAPIYVESQSTGDKVEQKADQAWQKTKDVTRDAKSGVSDSWLTARTKIALFADERVKGRQVGVETVKGVVTLRGKVDSAEAKIAAASLTEGIEGVKSVRNDLQVVAPADWTAVDISDKDITSQVKGRVSKDPRLKNVDVRTDRGVVSLTGDVPGIGASARASELAREVSSVRSVKNELIYDDARSNGNGPRSRSADGVTATQQALKAKGFDPGPIDGVIGLRTVSALKDYQKSENLAMTGRMDRDTAAKLGAKAAGSEKRPSQ
jgi:hyperosmotically inducible periplasmic protein